MYVVATTYLQMQSRKIRYPSTSLEQSCATKNADNSKGKHLGGGGAAIRGGWPANREGIAYIYCRSRRLVSASFQPPQGLHASRAVGIQLLQTRMSFDDDNLEPSLRSPGPLAMSGGDIETLQDIYLDSASAAGHWHDLHFTDKQEQGKVCM